MMAEEEDEMGDGGGKGAGLGSKLEAVCLLCHKCERGYTVNHAVRGKANGESNIEAT